MSYFCDKGDVKNLKAYILNSSKNIFSDNLIKQSENQSNKVFMLIIHLLSF